MPQVLGQIPGCGQRACDENARVRISAGNVTVTEGPFPDDKNLIGGYAIFNLKSKQEAIEWAKQFLAVVGEGESELRQFHEAPSSHAPALC